MALSSENPEELWVVRRSLPLVHLDCTALAFWGNLPWLALAARHPVSKAIPPCNCKGHLLPPPLLASNAIW